MKGKEPQVVKGNTQKESAQEEKDNLAK